MTALVLLIALIAQTRYLQETANSPAVEAHIRDVIKELPADSLLCRGLLQGARGNGVHYSWMDDMRKQDVRRAVIWVDISFDSKGHPKKMSINRLEYFMAYDGGVPISESTRLETIRTSALEKELSTLALEKARHGYWIDIPRPRPRPFIGGTHVDFLADEWLPSLSPLYYAK